MRKRFIGSLLAVVAVLAVSPVILVQTAKETGAAKAQTAAAAPDLSGVWMEKRGGGRAAGATGASAGGDVYEPIGPGYGFTRQEPPMQPWAEEKYRAAREGMKADEKGRDDLDPNLYCIPQSMPGAYTAPFPLEIVQAPGRVYMLFEANALVRRIYTDGRKPDEAAGLAFMGHSTGKWDGDTLVVETVGLKDLNWLDRLGHPHSDALRVEERIRRVNHDTLQIDFLFDDPMAYTKPWTGRKVFALKPDWEIQEQFLCEEPLREGLERTIHPLWHGIRGIEEK